MRNPSEILRLYVKLKVRIDLFPRIKFASVKDEQNFFPNHKNQQMSSNWMESNLKENVMTEQHQDYSFS